MRYIIVTLSAFLFIHTIDFIVMALRRKITNPVSTIHARFMYSGFDGTWKWFRPLVRLVGLRRIKLVQV